jgi:hypothetical protein
MPEPPVGAAFGPQAAQRSITIARSLNMVMLVDSASPPESL